MVHERTLPHVALVNAPYRVAAPPPPPIDEEQALRVLVRRAMRLQRAVALSTVLLVQAGWWTLVLPLFRDAGRGDGLGAGIGLMTCVFLAVGLAAIAFMAGRFLGRAAASDCMTRWISAIARQHAIPESRLEPARSLFD